MSKKNTTLIIGLGNPILGDDGVGWVVAEEIKKIINESPELFEGEIEFIFLSLGGLSLMEQMEGYSNVLIIDSIHTGTNPNGTIFSLPLSRLPNLSSGHSTAVHDTSLANALEIGKMMNIVLPDEVWILAIETDEIYDFSEKITEVVTKSIPKTIEIIHTILIDEVRQEQIIKLN